jgi:protocatechuate 3,4-dioxygenase beta subunit
MSKMIIRHYGPRAYPDHPPFDYPAYKSTIKRNPRQDLLSIVETLTESTGPGPVWTEIVGEDADLTTNAGTGGQAIGERIIVTGQVLDENGNGIPNTVLEIWQANAAGRYAHFADQHNAPLDPNFLGAGRCVTDDDGRYRFYTVKPGAYPWKNHHNAWRPNHIHFSLFGPSFATRLVTQMYFPGDPLLDLDPIYQGAPEGARERMIARFSIDVTEPEFALGYVFDIVLRGRGATPMET